MADEDHPSLRESNKYLPGDIPQEFEQAKADFLMLTQDQRIAFMRTYDEALRESLDRKTYATRGDAQLLTHQRELRYIHAAMVRSGR
jgi:hypothetical protein